ncbi:MAG TPA: hypothetical protein VFS54_02430 [Solirubrobacterales bacterium]|nr:hypothetical protein [Solirubrobacterales bacterium]
MTFRKSLRALVLSLALAAALIAVAAPVAMAAAPAWRILGAVGPTNLPSLSNEIQEVTVDAAGGTFTLGFGAAETSALAFGSKPADVEEALNELSTVGGSGGLVEVSGGPTEAEPTHPYFVRFREALGGTDVAALSGDSTNLVGGAESVSVSEVTPGGDPGEGTLAVYVTNVGGAATTGSTTLSIGPLPAGITTAGDAAGPGWTCSPGGVGNISVSCTHADSVGALKTPEPVNLPLQVDASAAPESMVKVEVSGGGAALDPSSRNVYEVPIAVSEVDAKAGIQALWAEAWDAEGQTSVLAGAHPNAAGTMFLVNTVRVPSGHIKPAGDPRDVIVDLPPGFVGNPLVTDRCPNTEVGGCGLESFVGEAMPFVQSFGAGKVGSELRVSNDEPPTGYAAQFTFRIIDTLASVLASVRSDEDFGVRLLAPNIPGAYSVYGSIVMLEGSPPGAGGLPFLTNPTSCAEQAARPPITKFVSNSWQVPDLFDEQIADIAPVTGCAGLEFKPGFSFQPSKDQAATGTAATAHLHVDQEGLFDAAKRTTPHLKRSTVTLPVGLTLNPSAAAGLEACSTEQIGYLGGGFPMPNPTRFDMDPVTCPDASKIGTAEIETPLLEDPLAGTVYLAAQNDNPFGSLLAMYLVIEDEKTGTVVKLPGEVKPNSETGQLTAVFDNNPQVPFTDLTLNFRGGGPRSTLATPDVCGTYTTNGEFTPWSAPESGPAAKTADEFTVSSGPGGKACANSKAARPFTPPATAGTVGVQAGGFSPFVLHIDRVDGEQELKRIDIALPPGLTGKLAGIPYCPEMAIEAAKSKAGKVEQGLPSCPLASRIGKVTATAGVGSEPISVDGTAYLAGPYEKAPLSVVVITPAVAGPFDLGNVVIRTPLYVDPQTARLRAVSDQIPHILQGLPLQLRSLSIEMDRDNFTLNPTNCERMSVGVATTGAGGDPQNPGDDVVFNQSVPFQVAGCGNLGFSPKLQLKLKGPTKRSGNPGFRAVLTQPPGEANISRTVVILPRTAFIDNSHINNPCTRVEFAANACPPKSILGTARAWSPLLDAPLEGNVYFRSNGGERELPDIVATLKGQVEIELVGYVDAVPNKGGTSRVRNTFAVVPDAPVSRFELDLKGGKVGLIENSDDLCRSNQRATIKMVAQNGRKLTTKPLIKNDCRKKKGGKGNQGRGGKARR